MPGEPPPAECQQNKRTDRTLQQNNYDPLVNRGAEVERVDTFKYLVVTIARDLSCSLHINIVVKNTRQHLHLPRQLRDFKLSLKVLRNLSPALSWAFCARESTLGWDKCAKKGGVLNRENYQYIYIKLHMIKVGTILKQSQLNMILYYMSVFHLICCIVWMFVFSCYWLKKKKNPHHNISSIAVDVTKKAWIYLYK